MSDTTWLIPTLVSALLIVLRLTKKEGWFSKGIYRKFSALFPVFLTILIIKGSLFIPLHVPTESMVPTLRVGDVILVNRYEYGTKIPATDLYITPQSLPKRGDVIVFKYPVQPNVPYVKRVIGLPGDYIEYKDKKLFVNGTQVATTTEPLSTVDNTSTYSELLPNQSDSDKPYTVQIFNDSKANDKKWNVPAGSLFVLGDNRDGSRDSRYWGYVKLDYLIGKVDRVFMNYIDGNFSITDNRKIF